MNGRTDRQWHIPRFHAMRRAVKIINIAVVCRFRYIQPVWIACHWLAMSNCCYNPIVYCWMNDKFRIGFRYAFRWCPSVRRPDVPPTMVASEWVGGSSPMYGGIRLSEAVTRGAGGHRARGGSATLVSLSAAGRRSPRMGTEVVVVSAPCNVRRPTKELLRSDQKTCHDHHRRETRNELEAVAESC